MKQKHTKKKSANRGIKETRSRRNYAYSMNRVHKREWLQKKKRHYGMQVRQVQTIKLEKYNGVRYTAIKVIEHVD